MKKAFEGGAVITVGRASEMTPGRQGHHHLGTNLFLLAHNRPSQSVVLGTNDTVVIEGIHSAL
jgi:hypothetical protein